MVYNLYNFDLSVYYRLLIVDDYLVMADFDNHYLEVYNFVNIVVDFGKTFIRGFKEFIGSDIITKMMNA